MKSLFKRAFAAVTSSALVLSQIAATAAPISAANDPLTVNKAWVLKVPFGQKEDDNKTLRLETYLKTIAVNDAHTEAAFAAGDETKNMLASTWNDEFESMMAARLGTKSSITQKTDATKIKQSVKSFLINNVERISAVLKSKMPAAVHGLDVDAQVDETAKLIDDETAAKIEAKIHDEGEMVIKAAGNATETVKIDDIGEIIGKAMVNYIRKTTGFDFLDKDGKEIEFDWSDFHIEGSVAVTADYSKFDKTISYSVAYTYKDQETGKDVTIDNFADMTAYFLNKAYNQQYDSTGKNPGALNIIATKTAASRTDNGRLARNMGRVNTAYANKDDINTVMEMFKGLTVNDAGSPDDAYTSYIGLAEEGLKGLGIQEEYVSRIIKTFESKRPQSLTGAAAKADKSPKLSKVIDQGIGFIHKIAGDKAKVELTTKDMTDIIEAGTNWDTDINGFNMGNKFNYHLEDSEVDSLLEAVKNVKDEEYKAAYQKVVKEVQAHKIITLNSNNDYQALKGDVKYDVELVIDKLILEDYVPETTTSVQIVTTTAPVVTTSNPGVTTTSNPSVTTSNPSVTTSNPSVTTSNPSVTTSNPSVTTSNPSVTTSNPSVTTSNPSVTTSNPSVTTSNPSVTTSNPSVTTSNPSVTTSNPSVTTSNPSVTTSNPSVTTSNPNVTTSNPNVTTSNPNVTTSNPNVTTSNPNVTTTAASSLEFVQSGVAPELIYWSEEETEFSFVNMKVTMNIYTVNAEKTGYDLAKAVDVTAAFTPSAKSPKDFEFTGFSRYDIKYLLSDLTIVEKAITDAGFDAAALMKQDGIEKNFNAKGNTPLYLVLRGDYNLDNKIDMQDAVSTLNYSVATGQTGYTSKEAFDRKMITAKDAVYNNLKYTHYAVDTLDGAGTITANDAKAILDYFVATKMTKISGADDWTYAGYIMKGKKITPLEQLHSDPYALDKKAVYGEDDPAHPLTTEN